MCLCRRDPGRARPAAAAGPFGSFVACDASTPYARLGRPRRRWRPQRRPRVCQIACHWCSPPAACLLRLANARTRCYNVGHAPTWQWRPVYMAKRPIYMEQQKEPLSPRVVALRAGQAGRSPWEGTRSASLSDRAGAMCSAGASSCRLQTTRPRRRRSRGRGARQTRPQRTWGQRLGRRSMERTRCVHRDGDCCTSMMTSSLSKR